MPALALDPIEARIVGTLIEKELTTPEQYPLSLNALTSGCNQKSNRAPVLELREAEIKDGLERLRRKGLVGASHSAGARIERYRHTAMTVWELSEPELAVVAELLLRGAQMPGELRGRADRMSRIETLESLGALLESLRAKGFVRRLEPLPGARAPSWEQILVGMPTPAGGSSALTGRPSAPADAPSAQPPSAPPPSAQPPSAQPPSAPPTRAPGPGPAPAVSPAPRADLERRVAALEAEVARLGRLFAEQGGA